MIEAFIILPLQARGTEEMTCLKKRHTLLIPPVIDQGIRIPDWGGELQVADVLQDLVAGTITVRVKPEDCRTSLAEEVEQLEAQGWVITEDTV